MRVKVSPVREDGILFLDKWWDVIGKNPTHIHVDNEYQIINY